MRKTVHPPNLLPVGRRCIKGILDHGGLRPGTSPIIGRLCGRLNGCSSAFLSILARGIIPLSGLFPCSDKKVGGQVGLFKLINHNNLNKTKIYRSRDDSWYLKVEKRAPKLLTESDQGLALSETFAVDGSGLMLDLIL